LTPVCYISVDIETAGPAPSRYPLLSIGACLVENTQQSFYVELQPDLDQIDRAALAVSGLDPQQLRSTGSEPAQALTEFADWVRSATPDGAAPVFVAYNAPFDWMFVQDYFQRYKIVNPFGHAALDIKALAMGLLAIDWMDTAMSSVAARLETSISLSHNALEDARDQALLFRHLLGKMESKAGCAEP
jgi:ribonuclease T